MGERRAIANFVHAGDGLAADRAEKATWITDEFGEDMQRYVEQSDAIT